MCLYPRVQYHNRIDQKDDYNVDHKMEEKCYEISLSSFRRRFLKQISNKPKPYFLKLKTY